MGVLRLELGRESVEWGTGVFKDAVGCWGTGVLIGGVREGDGGC